MRVIRYNFLFVIGLALLLGATTAFGYDHHDKDHKRPKDAGTLTVRTTPAAYPIKIDGEYRGMSGVNEAAIFYLTEGTHRIYIEGPNGQVWEKDVYIARGEKNCICLKVIERTEYRPCPYDFHLTGPDMVEEGDTIIFTAINNGKSPVPIRFAWSVSNGQIIHGQGTDTIEVGTRGMRDGDVVRASLDVNDDVYDNKCRQSIYVPTRIHKTIIPPPERPRPFRCDAFPSKSADDDKARFDNCVIQAQNAPNAQLYVIIYPGNDKLSLTRLTYERLSKRALDYMVNVRHFDPRRLQIVKGSTHPGTTMYELWIVPPGAEPPPIN
ncbi:MAG: hypothetical protein JO053_06615 [Acidobacteria bacterium]|nr:hypothetical protein [Acidobacteriota bacterium]